MHFLGINILLGGFLLAASSTIYAFDGDRGGRGKVNDQIQGLIDEFGEVQMSMKDKDTARIIGEISAILGSVLTELEYSTSFQSNMTAEFEKLRSEMEETKCSLSSRIIEMENEISDLKSGSDISESPVSKITKDKPRRPKLIDDNFILTPSMEYAAARRHCYSNRAKPFVPKTRNEFFFIVDQTTRTSEYGWLPLTDILIEGESEWDDGTSYSDGPVKFSFTDKDWIDGNSEHQDCVDVSAKGIGDWFQCEKKRPLLCIKTS